MLIYAPLSSLEVGDRPYTRIQLHAASYAGSDHDGGDPERVATDGLHLD